ncbi:uncharacterized protein LOC132294179 isoform X2 [Cornus florida]|uniref:uncharacterized protein LOC132294179 isoform X2 n=1 Tax=Cornus florida TaxID=4283 RepID=UPI00289F80AB|nr:uncharacterized protein LOC132294179 isoform X2 [Cornus florida]XP_059647925.1 uncharacterized protein LOC132294179 isoform X2 [Cornus florida]XP_059647926.1 uncharacterized protein LOC132294179 isoform X2 [Cornus florida]XP_059647927.1 uncharacterized protein LOC132294179 isoform X2 [Cornus florida]
MDDMDPPPFMGGFPYKFSSHHPLIALDIPPDEVKLIPWIAKRALAIPAESVDEHSAHLFVTHENLRRLYQLDVENKYALYEEVSIPLSIWQLKNEPVYEATYENLSAWRTTEVTKALVKGLLSCIMTMHDKGFCLGEELTSDHVWMLVDSPELLIKTTSIHVLHPSDDLIRDYKRFGQFVRSVIFGRCTIPEDMDSFLLLLEDKRVDESKLYLLERHAAVSNAQQRIDFLMRVVTETRALERIVRSSFINELNKWDFGYNKPWRDCIPLNSDAHNVYTFEKKKRNRHLCRIQFVPLLLHAQLPSGLVSV